MQQKNYLNYLFHHIVCTIHRQIQKIFFKNNQFICLGYTEINKLSFFINRYGPYGLKNSNKFKNFFFSLKNNLI